VLSVPCVWDMVVVTDLLFFSLLVFLHMGVVWGHDSGLGI
jgi:hypothetical protein